MVKITVIGDLNVDILTSPIERYPKKDSQVLVECVKLEVGGGAAHFAMAISKLGIKTRFIGLLGKDFFGDFVIEEMRRFGIESRIKRIEKETGISVGIHFKDGSRSLITFRGTNSLFSFKDFRLEEIEGKVLYIGGYNLQKNFQKDVKKVLSYAKEKGMITCLEPDLKSGINCNLEELKNNLELVDFFFPDLEEGRILTKEKDEEKIVEKILGFGCKNVALKLGEKGCLVASKEKTFRIGAIKTRAINPTGAGDFFNAGFVFGYLKHKKIEKAGVYGNALASFAISKFGSERFPERKELEKIVSREYGKT
ncbi:MAG: carbohydrate kinase family protein [Candidatus Aenigmarchaeota archaeon]|nr:carbohydrate kinase family protein [Candidatus Aenigmarchaeota archaeon]